MQDAKLLAHLNSCFIKRGIEANPGKMPVVDCKVRAPRPVPLDASHQFDCRLSLLDVWMRFCSEL